MRRVLKLVRSLVRRVYYRLAGPLLNRMRAEWARDLLQMQQELGVEATQLARAREEIYAEMLRISQGVVDYHESLTQKMADELTKIHKQLESRARAA